MKPALLRPQAQRDLQTEVRYYRNKAGSKVAVRLVVAANAALDQLELAPGMGSPALGAMLGIPSLRTWRVNGFPIVWCYIVRDDHLDVVRLLGERQDVAAILRETLDGN